MLALSALLAAASMGCEGADPYDNSGNDGDTDSDTDSDADTDSDSDADTDTDSDTGYDDPNIDHDDDGYTPLDGDCNDDDPNTNPDAIEVIVTEPFEDGGMPDPADEDCDGTIDNPPGPCDEGIGLEDVDPMQGARVIELCKMASVDGTDYGVISAAYVRADGPVAATPTLQIGVQTNFGSSVMPMNGVNLLALSSGTARTPGQTGACNANSCLGYGVGNPPPGFPQDSPSCTGGLNINDDVGLQVTLRAPSNATGYRFKFRFYSFEYPEWVCTTFNDQFIALVDPAPEGSIMGNISFDSTGNPVSVNIAFFTTCSGCPDGTADLAGTGFDGSWGDDAGATSWLQSVAPIEGGDEFTIRFTIWDTGDTAWDSTVLLDGFEWIATGGSPDVSTDPIIVE